LTVEIISNGTVGFAPATLEFEANVTGQREQYTISSDDDDGEESDDDDDDDHDDHDQTVLHTFEEAATSNVTLTAMDSKNQNASDSIEIQVESAEVNQEDETSKNSIKQT
jgi:PKD repeat protein